MEEFAVIQKRFGDEQSTLVDQFERMSFGAHLSRVMQGRSLSEPGFARSYTQSRSSTSTDAGEARAPSGRFHMVLKKLLQPIPGKKSGARKQPIPDPQHPLSWKAFSRTLRF